MKKIVLAIAIFLIVATACLAFGNSKKFAFSPTNISAKKGTIVTYNEVGTAHYHCSIHTEMIGKVTVTS